MIKLLIGSLVAAIIAFAFQAISWMGEFYPNFTNYTEKQDSIMLNLSNNLSKDGLYMIPNYKPGSSEAEKEQYMKKYTDKPWAMLFYHNKMDDSMGMNMIHTLIHNFVSAFIISLIIFYGNFAGFWKKFFVAFGITIVVVLLGIMDDYLWWTFPMQFIAPQIIDLLVGWGLASLWLAFFIKRKVVVAN